MITAMIVVVCFLIVQRSKKKPSITVSKGITDYNSNNNDYITFPLTGRAGVHYPQDNNNKYINDICGKTLLLFISVMKI